MTTKTNTQIMALFCDFENVALGVRDAQYSAFNIQKVLERLLLKGNIVVKKAYCDWERYKEFKRSMHEAAFELIEIPHVRQTGKNSADIRMVVDALDLCYTKSHVDTFVIISGDSDFSPLVSKLRENNKVVIGVGVKQSTSDLLIANCDEFIYYDDLVRDEKKPKRRRSRSAGGAKPAERAVAAPTPDEAKRQEAIDLVMETVEALLEDRDEEEKLWGSMVKQALKRRRPGFNESYHGFRTFAKVLEAARDRGLLQLEYDEKSGGYIIHMAGNHEDEAEGKGTSTSESAASARPEVVVPEPVAQAVELAEPAGQAMQAAEPGEVVAEDAAEPVAEAPAAEPTPEVSPEAEATSEPAPEKARRTRAPTRRRSASGSRRRKTDTATP